MSIVIPLKEKIEDLLSSNNLMFLVIRGKIGNDTSVELAKLLKTYEDDPKSHDLFFGFYHNFDSVYDYLTQFIQDIRDEFKNVKDDKKKLLELEAMLDKNNLHNDIYGGFSNFLYRFSKFARSFSKNTVFLLDPLEISNLDKFDELLSNILKIQIANIKWIVYIDSENTRKLNSLYNAKGIIHFKIPTSTDELIAHLELKIQELGISKLEKSQYHKFLGKLYAGKRNLDKSLYNYLETLNWYKQSGELENSCEILSDIALMYYIQRNFESSIKFYHECLDFSLKHSLHRYSILSLKSIAKIKLESNKKNDALEYYKKCLEMALLSNDELTIADISSVLGEAELEKGKNTEALNYFEKALELHRKISNPYGEARDLKYLSEIYTKIGKIEKSKECQILTKEIQINNNFSLD